MPPGNAVLPTLCFLMQAGHAHWLREQKSAFISMLLVSEIPCQTSTYKKEQEKDLEFFQSQGVKLPFLKRMFQHSSKTLWYPEYQELIDSGFLNSSN